MMAGLFAIHERLCGRESELPAPSWQWLDEILQVAAEDYEDAPPEFDMDDLE
jgi:hypothetical protein